MYRKDFSFIAIRSNRKDRRGRWRDGVFHGGWEARIARRRNQPRREMCMCANEAVETQIGYVWKSHLKGKAPSKRTMLLEACLSQSQQVTETLAKKKRRESRVERAGGEGATQGSDDRRRERARDGWTEGCGHAKYTYCTISFERNSNFNNNLVTLTFSKILHFSLRLFFSLRCRPRAGLGC